MSQRPGNELYQRAIIVDACAAVAPFSFVEGIDPGQYLNAYAEAGVTFVLFTVVDDKPNSIEQSIKLLGANRHYIRARPERFTLTDDARDVRRAKAVGKLAVGFAFQERITSSRIV
jgi:hypothetical protein